MRPGSSKDSSLSAPFLHGNTNNDDTADYGTQPKSKSKNKWESGITLSVLMNVLRFLSDFSNISELLALRLVSQMFYEAVSSREMMFPIVGSKMIMLSSQFVHHVMSRVSICQIDAESVFDAGPVFVARCLPINIWDHQGVQRVLSLPSWNDIKDCFIQYDQSQSEVLRRAAYQELSNEDSILFQKIMSTYDNGLASDNGLTDVFKVSEDFIKKLQLPFNRMVAWRWGFIIALTAAVLCGFLIPYNIQTTSFFTGIPMESFIPLIFFFAVVLIAVLMCVGAILCCYYCPCAEIPQGAQSLRDEVSHYVLGKELKKYLNDFKKSIAAAPRVGFFTAPAVAASSGTVIAMPSDQADGLVNQVAGGAARSV